MWSGLGFHLNGDFHSELKSKQGTLLNKLGIPAVLADVKHLSDAVSDDIPVIPDASKETTALFQLSYTQI